MGTPVVLADRVLVSITTTGTGTYSLGSAVTGYLTPALAGVSTGARVAYVAVDSLTAPTAFEVGEGVYTSGSPDTLTRAQVRRNTTGGTSAVNWGAGTKYLMFAPSAGNLPTLDTDGAIVTPSLTLTGLLSIAAGTQTAPGLVPSGDANTGLWAPAADTLAFSTGGVERLRISATAVAAAGAVTASSVSATTTVTATGAVTGAQIRAAGSTSGYAGLKSPATGPSVDWVLPSADAVGALQSDGAGNLSISRVGITASTSKTLTGLNVDFAGLPAGVRRVLIMLTGASLSGSSHILVQIGGSSLTTSGYTGSGTQCGTGGANNVTSTSGFLVYAGATAALMNGVMTLVHLGGNLWVQSHAGSKSDNGWSVQGGGSVTLAGALEQLRLTSANTTDTFDAGSVNILYET